MRRFIVWLVVFSLFLICLVPGAGAAFTPSWNYSYVSDVSTYSVREAAVASEVVYSTGSRNIAGGDFLALLNPSFDRIGVLAYYNMFSFGTLYYQFVGSSFNDRGNLDGVGVEYLDYWTNAFSFDTYGSSNAEFLSVAGLVPSLLENEFLFDVDLSSLPSFNAFSVSGNFEARSFLYGSVLSDDSASISSTLILNLYVNGNLTKTWSGNAFLKLEDYVYSSVYPVESISLGVVVPVPEINYDYGTLRLLIYQRDNEVPFTLSLFDGNLGALDGVNAGLSEKVDDYISAEQGLMQDFHSQWDSFDFENYKFSTSLGNAFTWVSARFSDFYSLLGSDLSMVILIPMTLGLALFIISGSSKFWGRLGR